MVLCMMATNVGIILSFISPEIHKGTSTYPQQSCRTTKSHHHTHHSPLSAMPKLVPDVWRLHRSPADIKIFPSGLVGPDQAPQPRESTIQTSRHPRHPDIHCRVRTDQHGTEKNGIKKDSRKFCRRRWPLWATPDPRSTATCCQPMLRSVPTCVRTSDIIRAAKKHWHRLLLGHARCLVKVEFKRAWPFFSPPS